MPFAAQDLDGIVTVNLGSKGVIELELVSSGEKWGRGPAKDIHSSLKAMVDSPAWHLVKALNTLVSDDGNVIMIDNYPKPLPLSAEEKAMIEKVSKTRSEAQAKKQFSVQHWINDLPWEQANERLESQPTVNIEGLVGGYTGPGGKTILAASRRRENRHATRARYESGGRACRVEGASGEARLRRHRSEHDRRVRSDGHVERFGIDPGAGWQPTKNSESTRCSGRAMPARIPVMSSPANRLSWPPDISDLATAAARMRRTNITSSNPRTRKSKTSTAR